MGQWVAKLPHVAIEKRIRADNNGWKRYDDKRSQQQKQLRPCKPFVAHHARSGRGRLTGNQLATILGDVSGKLRADILRLGAIRLIYPLTADETRALYSNLTPDEKAFALNEVGKMRLMIQEAEKKA